MLESLISLTAALLIIPTIYVYVRYRDVFHPLLFVAPMAFFLYVYMPTELINTSELFLYLTPSQAVFAQLVIVFILAAFVTGCLIGSKPSIRMPPVTDSINPRTLINGAFVLGAIGFTAWAYMMSASGGVRNVFSQSYGAAWSDIGYIRDAVFLLLAGLLLLLTPESWRNRTRLSFLAIAVFSMPWLLQGLLGARRGPIFVTAVGVGMAWYLARGRRPSVVLLATAGASLGMLMLFLVTNRSAIYIGSEKEFTTDIGGAVTAAHRANEYIYSAGCINASEQKGKFYWGKRYLAQVFVRPIPRQIWPTKYEDTVPELQQNAGSGGGGLMEVMGWEEEPGAAAAMAADLWVEFSWLAILVSGLIGWGYGAVWRRAITLGRVWITQYTILIMLSVYLVTQSMEAVIFRLLIISIPIHFVWRRSVVPLPPAAIDYRAHPRPLV